jgi:hypothetical protein
LNLDGTEYKLAFDFNALSKAEDETGLDMLKAISFIDLSARQYRALLYASMLRAQPSTTIEDAGNLCTPANFGKITDAILQAYLVSNKPADSIEKKVETPNSLTGNSGNDAGVLQKSASD